MGEQRKILIACTAPHHGGGLGQHFSYFVEAARADGNLLCYYTPRPKAGDAAGMIRYTPLRFFPGAINHLLNQRFDKSVARRLPRPDGQSPYIFMGFSGQALHGFRRAKSLGYTRLELVAGNSHVRNVQRLHAQAIARHPLERSWMNAAQIRKTLREYEMADVIYVASEYTRQSFVDQGVPEQKVQRIFYPVDPRFVPAPQRQDDGIFRIVYTGSLSVPKGIPVLIEAFARLKDPQARLTLVGGSGTRGMNRYLRRALAADPRIRIAPGDPLPHLQQADVYVHPSYEDNLPYAAAEALACGLTTIVTQDTGVKESVRDGVNGFVVPTGDADALLDRLQVLRCAQPQGAGQKS
jgi:glycosyltransferase involved in cell wall biosynthesis